MKYWKFFVIALILFSCDDGPVRESDNPVPASPASIGWLNSFGGPESDWLDHAIELANGSLIHVGHSSSSSGDISLNKGQNDIWVLKTSADGAKVWSKTLGGSGTDAARSILPAENGNLFILANTDSNDGDMESGKGERDAVVIKIDGQGNKLWSKRVGGTKFETAYDAVSTSDGGIALTGFTNSTDLDLLGVPNAGDADAWLVKIDANGNVQFIKSYGGAGFDVFTCMAACSDGGYIFAGYVRSSGSIYGHEWIVKVNDHGELVWQQHITGNRDEYPNSIIEASDGNIYVGGRTMSSDMPGFHGSTDGLITKLTSTGSVVWNKAIGGKSDDEIVSLVESNNKIFAAAATSSTDGDIGSNAGISDAWVLEFDSSGKIIRQTTIGSALYDRSNFITGLRSGKLLLVGLSVGSNVDIKKNNGAEDAFVCEVGF